MPRDSLRSALAEPAVAHPPRRVWRDDAIVAVFVAVALIEGIFRPDVVWRPLAVLLAIASIVALRWRRTHPLRVVVAVFGTVLAVDVVVLVRGADIFGLYSMAIILLLPYALFRWASGRDAAIGAGLIVATAVAGIINDWNGLSEAVAGMVILFFAFELGLLVRLRVNGRQRELDEVRWREREGLARELHDTVAHHVSGIAVQAQAGRIVGPNDPKAALAALEVIEEAASRTLIDMREIVRALRSDDDVIMGPQRGLIDVERLGEDTGVSPPVEVHLVGDLAGISPPVGAALYRLAQEAVTNARRHATEATRIDIRVIGGADHVRLEVTDDGLDARSVVAGYGFGLAGMTERARLLGGSVVAGPRPQRGWAVVASLPRRASS